MIVKPLDTVSFESIIKCFLSAFEKYFVKMPTDPDYYKARWGVSKVRFELSYGMFDNKKLVGFIVNGIDRRNGEHIAFNTGTGVLPEYRGKRIVKTIYDHAIPDLLKNGITKCALEVIKDNEIAIRSYKSIGFSICKHYKCFAGEINMVLRNDFELKELSYDELDWGRLPNQGYYSWDHHKNSIREDNYRYFQVIKRNKPQSYFIINAVSRHIAQFDILNDHKANWNDLLSGIKRISATVNINNIDERLSDKLHYIEAAGLLNTIDQYEMELPLIESNIVRLGDS